MILEAAGRPWWGLLLSLVAILGLLGGIGWQVIGWLQPATAIITIVGAQTRITPSRTLTVVTSAPNATQVAGRLLFSPTMSQTQTIPTTEVEHQPAEMAQGWITFYNALPAQQTVTAGTLLTGSGGVHWCPSQPDAYRRSR